MKEKSRSKGSSGGRSSSRWVGLDVVVKVKIVLVIVRVGASVVVLRIREGVVLKIIRKRWRRVKYK